MKKFISLLVLASFVAFVSCKKEAPDFTTENGGKDVKYVEMTFGASIEDADSNAAPESDAGVKAMLDPDDYHIVLWEKEDFLKVFPEKTTETSAIEGDVIDCIGCNGKTAYFKGAVEESLEGYYCIAAYSQKNAHNFTPLSATSNAGSFNGSIAETQRPVNGGVGAKMIPMVGWCEPGESTFSIHNTCGFIKVTLEESESPIDSIVISTSHTGNGKLKTNQGTTISGAQRFTYTGREVTKYGETYSTPGNFRNNGSNFITMLPSSEGQTTIGPGKYFLVASCYSGEKDDPADLFITVCRTAGTVDSTVVQKALLHASGIKIYRNKILALPAINPDKLNWVDVSSSALVSHVSDFTATADSKDEISVSGTLNVFQNTDAELISAVSWTILYKDQDDSSASWVETDLTGTGTAVSGTLKTLQNGMISGHNYSIRVKVNGGQCYSTPVKDVVPGVLEIQYDYDKDGNVFELGTKDKKTTDHHEIDYPKDGYSWSFDGVWWNQGKIVSNGGLTDALGFPSPDGYKLITAEVDYNAANSATTPRESYICDSIGITKDNLKEHLSSERLTIEPQAKGLFTIKEEKRGAGKKFYLTHHDRLKIINLTYLYDPAPDPAE